MGIDVVDLPMGIVLVVKQAANKDWFYEVSFNGEPPTIVHELLLLGVSDSA